MQKKSILLFGAAAVLLPSNAYASTDDTGGFNISVEVPVVCDLDTSEFSVTADANEISGMVNEYCNSARGFQVIASHRPLEETEAVDVNYGMVHANLERGGMSNIVFRSGPRLAAIPVRIKATGLESQLSVSFAITAV